MNEKIIKINKIFKSMDFLSKIFLVLIFLISVVYIFNKFMTVEKNVSKNSEVKPLEVSDNKEISVVDYSFDSNSKVRWPEDMYLIINYSKTLSEEEKNKLTYKMSPAQDFQIKYPNDYTLVVTFTKPSPKDGSYSDFTILYDGKQLKNINYYNSKFSTLKDPGIPNN